MRIFSSNLSLSLHSLRCILWHIVQHRNQDLGHIWEGSFVHGNKFPERFQIVHQHI